MDIDQPLLARVLDAVPLAVIVEREGRIIYANQASLALLASDTESLIGRSILDHVADRGMRTALAELLDCRVGTIGGVPLRSDSRVLLCDVSTFVVSVGRTRATTITLHLDGHDHTLGAVGLTRREWQIAELLADGHSVLGAASRLGCSESTVRTHLKAVYRKTGCHSRVELAHLVAGLRPSSPRRRR